MGFKKYFGNFQSVSQQVQRDGYSILSLDELMKRAVKFHDFEHELISCSAFLFNPLGSEVKISQNFTNAYFLRPENFNKCSVQLNPKDYDSVHGKVLSLDEFNSSLGSMSVNDARNNVVLNSFASKDTLDGFLSLYNKYRGSEINVDFSLPKVDFFVFSAMPVGLNSDGFCKGMSRAPCSGKMYLAKK